LIGCRDVGFEGCISRTFGSTHITSILAAITNDPNLTPIWRTPN
jgi:hypothetical protein